MRPFVEYRSIGTGEPLRQGDVIEAVAADASMWTRHLLVITADCDFANQKNHGRVTCVPFLSSEEYFLEFQLPRIREAQVRVPIERLQAILRRRGSEVPATRIRSWVLEATPAALLDGLDLEGKDHAAALGIMEGLRAALSPSESIRLAAEALTAAAAAAGSGTADSTRKRLQEQIRNAHTNPPGDAHFVSAIGPANESGYFAYLRHLEQIPENQIAIVPTSETVSYRRISRLRDRYTHALVQQFAMVFMPIGMPREYEETRAMYADVMEELLS